jgi:hypothetical protein
MALVAAIALDEAIALVAATALVAAIALVAATARDLDRCAGRIRAHRRQAAPAERGVPP